MSKIRGDHNPVDLMTMILGQEDIIERLGYMSIAGSFEAGAEG